MARVSLVNRYVRDAAANILTVRSGVCPLGSVRC